MSIKLNPSNFLINIASGLAGYFLPSSLALVLANMMPVYGVLYLGWKVFPIIFLYWAENIIIGLFNILKMALADQTMTTKDGNSVPLLAVFIMFGFKLFCIFFFCIHFGGFVFGHGIFLLALFKPVGAGNLNNMSFFQIAVNFINIAKTYNLQWPIIALTISHMFSFLFNYMWREEYKKTLAPLLFLAPYPRIVVIHLVIIFGAFFILKSGADSSIAVLLLFIGIKIALDLIAHLAEHNKYQKPRFKNAIDEFRK